MIGRLSKNLLLILALLCSGCSVSSLGSTEGASVGLIGGALGAGAGAASTIFDDRIIPERAAALGAGIGAGAGLITGALLYEGRKETEKKLPPIRVPAYIEQDDRRTIEIEHRLIQDESKWGQGEVLPWDERYEGESSYTPYQGILDPTVDEW